MAAGTIGFEPVDWRELIAVGLVANDLTPTTIARCAGVTLAAARDALDTATAEGLIIDGGVDPADAVALVTDLPTVVVAGVHTAVARYLLSEGPTRLLDAISHARSASLLVPSEELAAIADQAASTSLSLGDYDSARQFLEFANEFGIADTADVRARRLCDLAAALDGLGRVSEARDCLASAFDIAELAGHTALAVDAAVRYALPVDWYAGDRRTTALLQRAEAMDLDRDQRTMVYAARAMAEMRIPIHTDGDFQVAWITRPSVAQPLADVAMDTADVDGSDPARLLASLAWRATHRGPEHLTRRRTVSSATLDIAQRLRHPGRQVDAAIMVAVDSLESGDRPAFDHALTVLRWIADVDGNPRLGWHAHAVAAGAAHLDGDLEAAERHRIAARDLGMAIASPGWIGADLLLLGQELLARHDLDEIRQHLPDEAGTALLNPLGKLIVGQGHAIVGDLDTAERLLRRALRQFDTEASYLLCLTRATDLALVIAERSPSAVVDIAEDLWTRLSPWHEHVAVDSQAWYCDGPVAQWSALLAHHRNDIATAVRHLRTAETSARQLGDARSLDRLQRLRSAIGVGHGDVDGFSWELTDREREVMRMVIDGATNPQIAEALAYSPSTIRNDLTSIYRKFGVTSRPEATARAVALGITGATTG
jgi:DNA-binding CsgD family transcriptional regulator